MLNYLTELLAAQDGELTCTIMDRHGGLFSLVVLTHADEHGVALIERANNRRFIPWTSVRSIGVSLHADL